MIKTQYVTSDGAVFDHYQEASDHESQNSGLLNHIRDYINAEYSDDAGFNIIEPEDVGDYIINYWEDIKDFMARGAF